ncbi:MAG: YdcF family protein [Armatimonadota bacterium]|nr:YdcF family protein [Armatimonadota bacterium]MDR7549013.1 YdcF family protein [Armatimonadota bacterium]
MSRACEIGLLFILAAASVVVITVPAVVLQAIGDYLVVREPLGPADVVVAISGDGIGERARAAARLVLKGYGRVLIVSGPGSAARHMAEAAADEGLARERILIEDKADSTLENARYTADLMLQGGLRRAIVVTSGYHARRTAWVFKSEFAPRRLEARVWGIDNSYFTMERWWTRDVERTFVLREYAKLAAFLVGIR